MALEDPEYICAVLEDAVEWIGGVHSVNTAVEYGNVVLDKVARCSTAEA